MKPPRLRKKKHLKNESYAAFLIGQDILQWDFVDTYHNLTMKSIMTLKWASSSCPTTKFVVKMDDDVFFNVANLKKELKSLNYDIQVAGRFQHLIERQVIR